MTVARSTPSTTRHLSGGRKPKTPVEVTHERIAEDLEAFRLAGGKIEVLGVTRSLLRIGVDGDAQAPTPAPPAAPRRLHR